MLLVPLRIPLTDPVIFSYPEPTPSTSITLELCLRLLRLVQTLAWKKKPRLSYHIPAPSPLWYHAKKKIKPDNRVGSLCLTNSSWHFAQPNQTASAPSLSRLLWLSCCVQSLAYKYILSELPPPTGSKSSNSDVPQIALSNSYFLQWCDELPWHCFL